MPRSVVESEVDNVRYTDTEIAGATDLWAATLEVFDAGQQMVADRAALVRAMVVEDLTRITVAVALVMPSVVLGLLGAVGMFAALAIWLNRFLPVEAAVGLVSLAALVGCSVLAALAARQVRLMWKEEEQNHV